VDGIDDQPGMHPNKSLIIGGDGPFVPFPSHSFLGYLGSHTFILLLDCRQAMHTNPSYIKTELFFRAERKKDQVCSSLEYQKVFQRLDKLPTEVAHLVVQLGKYPFRQTLVQ
jgi:hypothetical protein